MIHSSIQLLSSPPVNVDTERSRGRCMIALTKYPVGQGRLVVGRGDGVNCQVLDGNLSRIHFQIELEADKAILSDLGSKQGTFLVRGQAKPRKLEMGEKIGLESGDCIKAGRSTFRFEIEYVADHTDQIELIDPAIRRPVTPTPTPTPTPVQNFPEIADVSSIFEVAKQEEAVSRVHSGSHSLADWPTEGSRVEPANHSLKQPSRSDGSNDSSSFLWPTEGPKNHESEVAPALAVPEKADSVEFLGLSFPTESVPTENGVLLENQATKREDRFDWYREELGELSLNQIFRTLQMLEERFRFLAIVHFAKVGEYTPAVLTGGEPMVQWLPPPIAFAYGPILVEVKMLERALSSETYQRLCRAQALSFCGSSDTSLLRKFLTSRESSPLDSPNDSSPVLSFLDQGFLLTVLQRIPLQKIVPTLGSEFCYLSPRKSENGAEWVIQSSGGHLSIC